MKKLRRTLALVMALSLTVPSVASPISLKTAYAQEQVETYEIGFEQKSDVIATFDSATGELRISGKGPTANFYTYTPNPFTNRDDIKSVIVEQGITVLGKNLFLNSSIENLYISEGVTEIGEGMCMNSSKLSHVILPKSLSVMRNNAFQNCSSLREIVIPENLKEIPIKGFDGCTNLEYVKISEGVEQINNQAFTNTAIRDIVVPSTVNYLSSYIFMGCSNLETITNLCEEEQTVSDSFYYDKDNLTKLSNVYGYDTNTEFKTRTVDAGYNWAGEPYVDTEKPVISSVEVFYTDVEARVLINATDNIGVYMYCINNTPEPYEDGWQLASDVLLLESGTYYAFAKDENGNVSEPYEFKYEDAIVDIADFISTDFKTDYEQGEALNLEGLLLKVRRESGKVELLPVTYDMIKGYNPNTIGLQQITIEVAEGLSINLYVSVSERQVALPEGAASIKVTVEDDKMTMSKKLTVTALGDVKEIQLPSGKVYDYTEPITYNVYDNGTYEFSVTGTDGYTESTAVVTVDTIDREKPEIETMLGAMSWGYIDVTDNDQVEKLVLPNGTEITPETLPYSYDYGLRLPCILKAYDRAGNEAVVEYVMGTDYYEMNAIEAMVTGIPKSWTNQDVTLQFYADSNSENLRELYLGYGMGMRSLIAEPPTEPVEKKEPQTTDTIPTEEIKDTNSEPETKESEDEEQKEPESEISEDIVADENKEGEITEPENDMEENSDSSDTIEEQEVIVADPVNLTPAGMMAPLNKEVTIINNGDYILQVANDRYIIMELPFTIDSIDKEAPVINVEIVDDTALIQVSDDLSGIKAVRLPDGSEIRNDNDGEKSLHTQIKLRAGEYEVYAEDYAGNQVSYSFSYSDERTVTYELNGIEGNPPSPLSIKKGDTFTVAGLDGIQIPENKIFVEWNTESDGSGVAYAPGTEVEVDGNITLFLILEDKKDDSSNTDDSKGDNENTDDNDKDNESDNNSSGGGHSVKAKEKNKDSDTDVQKASALVQYTGGVDKNGQNIPLIDGVYVSEKLESGYIAGYPDNTFRPNNEITRAEFVSIIHRIFRVNTEESKMKFNDISNSWAKESIEDLAKAGILKGFTDNSFKPEQPITREEVIMILANVIDTDGYDTSCPLTDIDNSHYKDEIARFYNAGIVSGDENQKFRYTDTITRAETVTLLNKILYSDLKTDKPNHFNDIKETDWFYSYVIKAVR